MLITMPLGENVQKGNSGAAAVTLTYHVKWLLHVAITQVNLPFINRMASVAFLWLFIPLNFSLNACIKQISAVFEQLVGHI